MTDQFTTNDAAYLLGALSPQDRAAYEAHLVNCRDCSRGVSQLAGLPGLLASVAPEQARAAGEPGPEIPDTLLPRLLAEVERARFRRRWTSGLVGAAAAAVVAVLVALGLHALPRSAQTTHRADGPEVQTMTALSSKVPISATATLADKEWGTLITIRCTYDGKPSPEYEAPATYTMVVVSDAGRTQQIAEWAVIPGQPAVVDGSTRVPQSKIASVQVLAPDDDPLLVLRP